MTDLSKAAEAVLEAWAWDWSEPRNEALRERMEALQQALARPEQEPEWLDDGFGTMWQKCGKKDCGKFVVKIGKVDCWNGDCPETNAPLKREWVGLTDEEIEECKINGGLPHAINWRLSVKVMEAKLKEKNT